MKVNQMSKEENAVCVRAEENPGCPYLANIIENSNDIKWIKSFIWKLPLINIAVYLALLLAILKAVGAI